MDLLKGTVLYYDGVREFGFVRDEARGFKTHFNERVLGNFNGVDLITTEAIQPTRASSRKPCVGELVYYTRVQQTEGFHAGRYTCTFVGLVVDWESACNAAALH